MPTPAVQKVQLVCHPESRNDTVHGIRVSVRRADGQLALSYAIEAKLGCINIPAARLPLRPVRLASPAPVNGPDRPYGIIGAALWQHTCCECFIALKGELQYHEFNFSPSGEWAAYAFAKYRDGAPLPDIALNPRIITQRSEQRLQLDATIPLGRVLTYAGGALELALAAVIEDADGKLSYWALGHPAGKPDFHRRESFLLEL